MNSSARRFNVLTLFGTRPEVIKLAPVIQQLESERERFRVVNVASGQHSDLVQPFASLFGVRIDRDLKIMAPGQTLSGVCARVLTALDPILTAEQPDLVLVQGDTTTAMAGALCAFHRKIPVGHVEAGLRSGDVQSPYPEEMNRILIGRLATYHFAATPRNRLALRQEGVADERIFVTGNTVVDALLAIRSRPNANPALAERIEATQGLKRIVLTTHRRESFGEAMAENLRVLRTFVERHPEVALLFPVHPNPVVVETTREILSGHPRIHLLEPMGYEDFLHLLSHAWLIVSDSGGVQEEAPTLGKPLLILRENTERPESVESGIARLVGGDPARLATLLQEALSAGSWVDLARQVENPFGRGDAAQRIVEIVGRVLSQRPLGSAEAVVTPASS
jgi:UDP-N-acetylglucosamine 2-epimerase (non-hydrolysing)